jgi:protein disulfide-isomerase A6
LEVVQISRVFAYRKITATLLLSALALADVSSAAIFNSKQVKQLTGKTFKKAVHGSEKLTVAAFVAPW